MQARSKAKIDRSISKNLTLASAIAALYAVLVTAFPATSIPVVQVRVADVLMPLAILFGWPAVLGLAIGAALGNLAGDVLVGLPNAAVGVDAVGGSLANLIAAFLAWKIGSKNWSKLGRNLNWFLATTAETAVIAIIVGSYLSWILPLPLLFSIGGILLGSIVAINIGGYSLLRVLGRPRTLDMFRSRGILEYNSDEEAGR